ncbi:MAG TPA: TlpA disulfide reductase family protein [Ramlibacter sp.]|nr:TlpA disulfide reductase family protein [Ramlibacter sp.]
MKRRCAIASLAGAAAWLAGCSDAPSPQARPHWPALAVRDLAGRPATLPAASGGARVINMWALWCPPCRQELPSLGRLASALAPRGIEVSAVALADDSFAVREYLREHAAGLPGVVLSPSLPAARRLGLDALPQTFVVAADSAVLARWTGAREWDSPSVRNQLDRLLQSA